MSIERVEALRPDAPAGLVPSGFYIGPDQTDLADAALEDACRHFDAVSDGRRLRIIERAATPSSARKWRKGDTSMERGGGVRDPGSDW